MSGDLSDDTLPPVAPEEIPTPEPEAPPAPPEEPELPLAPAPVAPTFDPTYEAGFKAGLAAAHDYIALNIGTYEARPILDLSTR